MSARPLIIEPLSDDPTTLLAFLADLVQPLYKNPNMWRTEVEEKSALGPYLVKGATELPATKSGIEFLVAEPVERYSPEWHVNAPWELLLHSISLPLTAACFAGGCKLLIDLLKVWVEERKGRLIRIKSDTAELEIRGGMNESKVRAVVQLFEDKFPKPHC